LDAPSFLEKALLPSKAKEKLMGLEEDLVVGETMRQLGQALATSFLVVSKLKEWRGPIEKKSHEVVELHQQVGNLKREMTKLHEELQQARQSLQEAKALLTEKSKEALGLSKEKTKLLAEMERLKRE